MNASNAATAVAAPPPSRWRAILIVLLVNAVPIAGVLYYDWSATNVLILYWVESLLIAVATTLRILAHRQLTRKRGHFRVGVIGGFTVNGEPVKSGLLGEYAMIAFLFTLAHGVFVAVLAYHFNEEYPDDPRWQFSLGQLVRGVEVVAAMLGIELVADLMTIRSRSFAWIKEYAQRRMGRILVLHLAIIFGVLAMAMANSPFGVLYVLIGLKTLVDLAGVAAQGAKPADAADTPPAWTMKYADKLARDKGGAKGFLESWNAQTEKARREAIEDEEVVP
jgi:hypothetical protein